jgi:BirA family biotin operon repressor/biotin-[acetyl-CoA-carboxylase] ligase
VDHQILNTLIEKLIQDGALEIAVWPDSIAADHFKLTIQSGLYRWVEPVPLLESRFIRAAVRLDELRIYNVVGSTNTELMAVAAKKSVHRYLYTAECQIAGRGRRGRTWASPFARNLAFSYGHTTQIPLSGLGGLSLVVGLAVAESISTLSEVDVKVKWPNDVVVEEQKLCGILVELVQKGKTVDVVIGIGVNVALEEADRADIDRDVTDVRALGINDSRTELLINIVITLQKFLARFEESGFEPFVGAFNEAHIYDGKACAIHQGNQIIAGQVEGVDVDGALILSTESGIRTFHGGEVSLRAT